MPMKERINSVLKIKQWHDKIPLHYQYTTGLAGERFYKGILEGKIIGSECVKCKSLYLPPKIYCVKCYSRIEKFVEIKREAYVTAIAEKVKNKRRIRYGFIKFKGVTGGLIHKVKDDVNVEDRVKPVFLAESKRKGELSDILYFVKA
jgi:uncharacterized OB-fold protein